MSAFAETARTRGRAQAQVLLGRTGRRVADMGSRPAGHRVLLGVVPQALMRRFDAGHAEGLEAVMELRVRDPSGGEPTAFALTIIGGTCRVTAGPADNPEAVATLGGDDMIRLVTGAAGWPALLAANRLEMFGDPFLALRFPLLFNLPSAATPGVGRSG